MNQTTYTGVNRLLREIKLKQKKKKKHQQMCLNALQ